jgi:hypothetical protein
MRALGRPLRALAIVVPAALATDPAQEPAPAFDAIATVGEVTQTSAILQARLGLTDTLVNGDIPGYASWGYFELSTDSAFTAPSRT